MIFLINSLRRVERERRPTRGDPPRARAREAAARCIDYMPTARGARSARPPGDAGDAGNADADGAAQMRGIRSGSAT